MKKLLLIFLLIAAWSVQAREVYPLCDDWLFSFRYENSSDNARCVTLPHTWNLDALAGTIPYLRTTADYQRKLYVPQTWTGKRLFLKFYGVESVAHLFVNGTYVGEHRGGTTAFVFEITDRVKYGSENLLRVAVSNAITGDVLPLSSIHNIYGGISREVELIVTDPTAVSPLYLGSSGVLIHPRAVSTERAEAEAEIHLTSKGDNFCRVTLEAFDPDGIQAAAKTIKAKLDGKPIVIPFTVENPRLWDLDHPNLYRMRVSVESDTSRDEIEIATGFRNIRVTPEEGFRLNDSLVRVHGVTLYYDRPGTGSAMEAEDYAEDFAFIRELGANALRSPAGPHAPCLYDLCDRTGVLVWIDLPLIRAPFLSDVSYYPNPQLEANGRQQLREIIAQHINRPSVVIWGLFDCLWQRGENPVPYVRTLNELAKKMDRSRPTAATSNQDGELNQITDLIVWRRTSAGTKAARKTSKSGSASFGRGGTSSVRASATVKRGRSNNRAIRLADAARTACSGSRKDGRPVFMKITRNTWHKTRCCGEPGSTPCSTTARPAVRRAWRLRGSSRWTDAAARTLSIFTRLCGTTRNRRSTSPDAGRMSVTATCRP